MKLNILEQKAYYDSRWDAELTVNSLQLARCAAILKELSRLELASPRIIDLGCGNGWLTSVLGHFGEAVGVDLSAQTAMQRFPNLMFYESDLTNWHPSLKPFDVAVSQEVIEHIEVQMDYVNVAADLLKPGGYLILTTPNVRTTSACSAEWRKVWLSQPVENIISAAQLRSILKSRFEIVRVTSINFGQGETLLYSIANSTKVRSCIARLGLLPLYEALLGDLKFGLQLLAVARKR